MTAEIISVGTELLLGNILNTNAQFLSRELASLGITVQRQSTVGDNHDRLAEWVDSAKARADLLVFTGGLGPTADDLTKETVAACYGDTLTFDPEEWEKITSFFTRMGRQTTPNNRKQAMVPVRGQKIPNAHGTAPGAWFEQDGRYAVLMPGVPAEMKAMWAEQVRPRLLAMQNCTLHSLTLRVLGGESDIEYRVRDLLKNENPTAAIYCKTGESEIRITARAASDQDGAQMCRAYAKKFYDLLGDAVYDEDVPGLAHTVIHTLAAKGMTMATAESCTGGLIAQQLTGVPGASDVFGYGFRPRPGCWGWTRRSSNGTTWCRGRWPPRWPGGPGRRPGRTWWSPSPAWPGPVAGTRCARWAPFTSRAAPGTASGWKSSTLSAPTGRTSAPVRPMRPWNWRCGWPRARPRRAVTAWMRRPAMTRRLWPP